MGTTARPVRSFPMFRRTLALAAIPILALSLAACERQQPAPQDGDDVAGDVPPVEDVPAEAAAEAAPEPAPRPAPKPAAPALDTAALADRQDPDRLVRFYAAALKARDWQQAARAWGAGSGVTASTLKAAYDRPERPILEVGKGVVEGAAGSLYYEAPVTLHFGAESMPERGTLTLRRVNDVPGARADQLRWHIERVTIGVGQ